MAAATRSCTARAHALPSINSAGIGPSFLFARSGVAQRARRVARPGGFEPPTHGLEGRCSIQLSYGRSVKRRHPSPCRAWDAFEGDKIHEVARAFQIATPRYRAVQRPLLAWTMGPDAPRPCGVTSIAAARVPAGQGALWGITSAVETEVRAIAPPMSLPIAAVRSMRPQWTPVSAIGDGRGGRIRTCDPLLPKQMRYQAALRPDKTRILAQAACVRRAAWPPSCDTLPTLRADRPVSGLAGTCIGGPCCSSEPLWRQHAL